MNKGIALALAFGAVLVGALVVTSGLRNRTLTEVVGGVTSNAQAAQAASPAQAGGAASGASSSSSSGGSGLASSAKTWLRSQAQTLKWSSADWESVIQMESGGNPAAKNPTSGAFGIGQFLGSTEKAYAKYGSESTQAIPQLNAQEHYIHDRYGTPTRALEHERIYKWY